MCMPNACGGQVGWDPLGLELQVVVRCHVVLEIKPGPLEEQRVLLTAEPPISPVPVSVVLYFLFFEIQFHVTQASLKLKLEVLILLPLIL